jgi:hypothetical protein
MGISSSQISVHFGSLVCLLLAAFQLLWLMLISHPLDPTVTPAGFLRHNDTQLGFLHFHGQGWDPPGELNINVLFNFESPDSV